MNISFSTVTYIKSQMTLKIFTCNADYRKTDYEKECRHFSVVNTTVLYSMWLVESVEMEESDTKGDSLYTVIHYV